MTTDSAVYLYARSPEADKRREALIALDRLADVSPLAVAVLERMQGDIAAARRRLVMPPVCDSCHTPDPLARLVEPDRYLCGECEEAAGRWADGKEQR